MQQHHGYFLFSMYPLTRQLQSSPSCVPLPNDCSSRTRRLSTSLPRTRWASEEARMASTCRPKELKRLSSRNPLPRCNRLSPCLLCLVSPHIFPLRTSRLSTLSRRHTPSALRSTITIARVKRCWTIKRAVLALIKATGVSHSSRARRLPLLSPHCLLLRSAPPIRCHRATQELVRCLLTLTILLKFVTFHRYPPSPTINSLTLTRGHSRHHRPHSRRSLTSSTRTGLIAHRRFVVCSQTRIACRPQAPLPRSTSHRPLFS